MPLTLNQKIDAFERYLRFLRRGQRGNAGKKIYNDSELILNASQFLRGATGWDTNTDAGTLVNGLKARWALKSRATRARNKPKRREKKLQKLQENFNF